MAKLNKKYHAKFAEILAKIDAFLENKNGKSDTVKFEFLYNRYAEDIAQLGAPNEDDDEDDYGAFVVPKHHYCSSRE